MNSKKRRKNCLRGSLPVVCAERISCLNEIHPIQAWLTDRINAQTFLNCDFFLQMTTRFWRFKKGLRNVWSNKKCSETPRLSSNITEIKLVSPSMYENAERKKIIVFSTYPQKTCFWCGFCFIYFFPIEQSKWNVILSFELIYFTCFSFQIAGCVWF